MTALRGVAVAVILCLTATAAPGQEPVTAPQLQQMVSIVRYLQDRVASEPSASLLSGDERFRALLESLRLFGMDVPDEGSLHAGMTPVELSVALLKGVAPARREVMVRDAARFLARQPDAASTRDDGAGALVRGRAILGLSAHPVVEPLPVAAAPLPPLPVAVPPSATPVLPPREPVVLPVAATPSAETRPAGTLDYGRLKSRIQTLFGNLTVPDAEEGNR